MGWPASTPSLSCASTRSRELTLTSSTLAQYRWNVLWKLQLYLDQWACYKHADLFTTIWLGHTELLAKHTFPFSSNFRLWKICVREVNIRETIWDMLPVWRESSQSIMSAPPGTRPSSSSWRHTRHRTLRMMWVICAAVSRSILTAVCWQLTQLVAETLQCSPSHS